MSRLTPLCALEEACTGMTGLGVTDPYEMQETPPAPPGPTNVPVSGQGPTAFSWLTNALKHVGASAAATVSERYATFAPRYESMAQIAAREAEYYKGAAEVAKKTAWEFRPIAMEYAQAARVATSTGAPAPTFGASAAEKFVEHLKVAQKFSERAQAASTPFRRLQSSVLPVATRVGTKLAPAIKFIGGRLIPVVSIAMDTYKIYESVQTARDVNRSLDQLESQVKDNTKASADRQAMTAQDQLAMSEQARITLIRAYSNAIARAERVWPFVTEEKIQITPTKVITQKHPATSADLKAAQDKLATLRARVRQLESSAPWARPK